MKTYIPGVQLYTVRDDLQADFEGTIRQVAEMGYRAVEFAGYYGGRSGEEIRDLLDKYHLIAPSVHHPIGDFLTKGQEMVDFFKAFGVKYVTIPHYPGKNYKTEEARKATCETFMQVAELLAKNEMVLQYHNHDFEFGKTEDGTYYLDWLYGALPADKFQVQLDTCWVHYGGEDPVKYIEAYRDRMHTIHFKDFVCSKLAAGPVYELIGVESTGKKASFEESGFAQKPVGQGIQDFDAMLRAMEASAVEYVIVELDDAKPLTAMEAIRQSMEWLRSRGL